MKPKEQIELAVIGVGVIVLIFLLVTRVIMPISSPKKSSKAPISTKNSMAKKDAKEEIKPGLLTKSARAPFGRGRPVYGLWKESTKDQELIRDPFSEEISHKSKDTSHGIGDFDLQGILWDDAKPSVIINGEELSVGESISGAKVIRIEKDSVILNNGSKEFKLNL